LGPVEILGLIDEQVARVRAPAREDRRVALEEPKRPRDEVVEVETALGSQLRFVREEGPRDGTGFRVRPDLRGRDPDVQLQPRERGVQPAPAGRPGVRHEPSEDVQPVDERLDPLAGVPEDLEPERMERPDPDRVGGQAQRRERGRQSLAELLGRAPVERDRDDGSRTDRPGGDQPGDSGHEGRRLAAARGCDAQDRAGRSGRGRALVRREPFEAVDDGWVERHPVTLAAAGSPVLTPPNRRPVRTHTANVDRPMTTRRCGAIVCNPECCGAVRLGRTLPVHAAPEHAYVPTDRSRRSPT
jgi:hypothetical protein